MLIIVHRSKHRRAHYIHDLMSYGSATADNAGINHEILQFQWLSPKFWSRFLSCWFFSGRPFYFILCNDLYLLIFLTFLFPSLVKRSIIDFYDIFLLREQNSEVRFWSRVNLIQLIEKTALRKFKFFVARSFELNECRRRGLIQKTAKCVFLPEFPLFAKKIKKKRPCFFGWLNEAHMKCIHPILVERTFALTFSVDREMTTICCRLKQLCKIYKSLDLRGIRKVYLSINLDLFLMKKG